MTDLIHKKLILAAIISGMAVVQGCDSSSSENGSADGAPSGQQAEQGESNSTDNSPSEEPADPGEPVADTAPARAIDIFTSREIDGQWHACAAVDANISAHDRNGNFKAALAVSESGRVDISGLESTDFVTLANETDESVSVLSAEVALLVPGHDLFIEAYAGITGECSDEDYDAVSGSTFDVTVTNAADFSHVSIAPVLAGGTSVNIDQEFSGPIVQTLNRLDQPFGILALGYNSPAGRFVSRLDKYQLINSQAVTDNTQVNINPVQEPVVIPLALNTPNSAFESLSVDLYYPGTDLQHMLEIFTPGNGAAREVRTISSDEPELILTRNINNLDMTRRVITRQRFSNDVTAITLPDRDMDALGNVAMSGDSISYTFTGDGADVVIAGGIRVYEPGSQAPAGAKAIQQGVFTASATGHLVMPDIPDAWVPPEPFQKHLVKMTTSNSDIQIQDRIQLALMEIFGNIITSSVLDDEAKAQLDTIPLQHRLNEPYTSYRVSSE
ncbi:hypothetical protein [Marinobacter sp. VGCF2001]|uniref:hypothetical protein n=1 Tax=Marinobacter sp. VGCF2001 TaxID=3417189 RepID=UPI003CFA4615